MTSPRASRLHIPEPPARPGQVPDFSNIDVSYPGAVPMPAIDAPASSLRDHAFGLVRVLADNGKAQGAWNPQLPVDTLKRGLRHMLLTRTFDERMLRVQRQGKTSFYIQCTGEEAVAVAQAYALRADDMLFPAYRQQGLLVARDWPLVDMMCQIYNNAKDRLKGRQLPIMYSVKDANFFSISGNLATQYPQAVGWAMAAAYKGDDRISAAWVGDGTTAESDFHHALTFATVYRAQCVLNVVNNQWAISSFQGIAGGQEATFAARAIGYGLPGLRVDGNDFLAVYAVTKWAAERARSGHGASLIELVTYRVGAHSSSDDPSKYRSDSEGARWPLGDPILRLKQHLIGLGEWSEAQHNALATELDEYVKACNQEAQSYGTLGSATPFSPDTMFEDVYKELTPALKRQQALMRSQL